MASVPKHVARHAKRSRQNYRRACDICNHEWPFSKLRYIGQQRWACPDDAPGLTAEQLARHQASLKPLRVRPRRHAKESGSVPEYLGAEARIFTMLRRSVASGSSVVTSRTQSGRNLSASADPAYELTTWMALYLVDLVQEGERPAAWMTIANSLLYGSNAATAATTGTSFARQMILRQLGSPTGQNPSFALNLHGQAGWQQDAFGVRLPPLLVANCGLLYLGLYQIIGGQVWLDAAILSAHALRNMQRADLMPTGFTATSNGGATPVYVGGWVESFQAFYGAGPASARFPIENAWALTFLARLRAIVGGDYLIGASTTIGHTIPPVATLDAAIAEAREFYVTGKQLQSGAPARSLLSTTRPASYYHAFVGAGTFASPDLSGDGAFHLDGSPETTVPGIGFAMALRGLFEVEGYSDTVAALFEYLMTFSSNPAFAVQAGEVAANTTNGEYDPEFCVSTKLAVDNGSGGAVKMNGSSVYDLAAAGVLAPIYIAAGRSLRALKDAVALPRRVRFNGNEVVDPAPTAVMGLSLQGISQDITVRGAAQMGMLYRYAPKGHPANKGLP